MLLLHAYSPSNAGDGLLVDLTLEMVDESIGDADVVLVASDAAAFADPAAPYRAVQWAPVSTVRSWMNRRALMLATIPFGPSAEVRRLASEADVILAVGGAYLRGGFLTETIKTWGAHYGQLKLASRHGQKAIYLPQSIGPFDEAAGKRIRERLQRVRRVYARDDKTRDELASLPNVRRVPDLAILALASRPPQPGAPGEHRPLFVARDLPRPRNYYSLLQEIADSGAFDWVLQSSGGDNDDRQIIGRYVTGPVPSVGDLLAEATPRVVVSTRLHGALSSLMAGYPAIHLSYERKGLSAFQDLGLDDFVLSARDANLAEVTSRVAQITADPGAYWARVTSRLASIADIRSELRDDIRAVVAATRQGVA
ncbi:polysaccharide pyruvyl transferase family protein [Microbacterium mangrovi]|uniref:polysaccharide pyruvyl transferase family protein n=1 Tax=Microbacterium mangrovi TaxID=1348253 RepID=UPI00068C42CD|nr:polysaccharide pyruvyl transferase family protein [Microbacterium mangrovi]